GYITDKLQFRGWYNSGANFTPWRNIWHDGNFDPNYDLVGFKKIYSRWDSAFSKKGWLSIYLANHDQPRMVSHWASDDSLYREAFLRKRKKYFRLTKTRTIRSMRSVLSNPIV
ncbi:MAG: hypothetical protein EOO01_41200, partial [Chitinophagaceae bacterium]